MSSIMRMFRVASFGVVLLIASVTPQISLAACGYDRVHIVGGHTDVSAACKALEQVVAYFREIGFKFEPEVRISFRDRVYVHVFNVTGAPTEVQVSGFYDAKNKEIQITSANSEFQETRRPWGIKWGSAIAYSILQHELAHMSVKQLLRGTHDQWAGVWLEFVAYSVQFELMDTRLRDAIMAGYRDAAPFESLIQVNPLIYGFDPDLFGVRAYHYVQANGGRQYIRRLLSGQLDLDTREILWTK